MTSSTTPGMNPGPKLKAWKQTFQGTNGPNMNVVWWVVHEIYPTGETLTQLCGKLCGKFHECDGCTNKLTNGRMETWKLYTLGINPGGITRFFDGWDIWPMIQHTAEADTATGPCIWNTSPSCLSGVFWRTSAIKFNKIFIYQDPTYLQLLVCHKMK